MLYYKVTLKKIITDSGKKIREKHLINSVIQQKATILMYFFKGSSKFFL